MTKVIDKEKERIRKVAHLLYDGARRVRILRSIDWPASVKQDFFAKGAKELPVVSYPGFDAKPTIDIIREARRMIIPVSPIDLWLERQSNSIETGARMLAGACTPVFFEHSRHIYGEPIEPCASFPPPLWSSRRAFKTSSTSSPALIWVLRHPPIFPPMTW